MTDVDIPLPLEAEDGTIEQAIDRAISTVGLTITLRGTLKKHPGCLHWHLKLGHQPGTLEVTFWPQDHRAWFTVQSGRKAPWIESEIKLVREAIGQHLTETHQAQ